VSVAGVIRFTYQGPSETRCRSARMETIVFSSLCLESPGLPPTDRPPHRNTTVGLSVQMASNGSSSCYSILANESRHPCGSYDTERRIKAISLVGFIKASGTWFVCKRCSAVQCIAVQCRRSPVLSSWVGTIL